MNTANSFNTLPRPLSVRPNSNYTLQLTFDNGEQRIFDATAYLKYPAFQALESTSLFMQARVAHNTVVWNDEIDMAPESLYLESLPMHLNPQSVP
jgi:hypothetical protein